ncbi:P-loop containing nucleoside triphosphate hydrolase protein [Biscogniauxia marginata]|nr:P-loop containing nucleoside triphosphate hydrolase protein [Biscogniauxia marginata]
MDDSTDHVEEFFHEPSPASIPLPPSPFLNPFNQEKTGSALCRSSLDGLPALYDDDQAGTKIESPAEQEWRRQKEELGEKNEALDKVMKMLGLENVKMAFLEIKSMIDASRSRQGHLKCQDLNLVLLGNPGTAGVISIVNTDFMGYDYSSYFLSILERLPDSMVVVISGSAEHTPTVLGSLSEGRWLFPRRLHLKDYDDDILRRIFVQFVSQDSLRIEEGPLGPYPRKLARRVGRGREETGFGNVYELRSSYLEILKRQAVRLREERAKIDPWVDSGPDESLLKGQDIIGPEPEDIQDKSKSWKELEKMTGLEDVKTALIQLFMQAKANYQREISGLKLIKTSLNRVFMGPPGTGKTTVAKLYGQVLAEIAPGDFIGMWIGESESKTTAILNETKGKVLIIDDAHTFYHGSRQDPINSSDDYRRACIDIIVSKIHNKPGEDRCIILLGYTEVMEEMLQKSNPGLRRRFPLEEAFRFVDYDDKHLNDILEIKMKEEETTATGAAMKVAAEVLRRARDRPSFGNGGDVVNLLNQAKTRQRDRVKREKDDNYNQLEKIGKIGKHGLGGASLSPGLYETSVIALKPEDFDPNYSRGDTAVKKCRLLFDGLIGFEEVIQRFKGYQCMAKNLRLKSKDPREIIPFTYVFKGPPGTGKTHTARIIGGIFYDMGFLSTSEVITCSATDLIGKYIGQTGPKVIDLFDRALGKVLFIDEAYRLGHSVIQERGNTFTDEAVRELVDCITRPRYHRKMIIVLAGYTHEMDQLMKTNAGLRGRFATEINFPPLGPLHSLNHFCNLLRKQEIGVHDEAEPDRKELETVLRLFWKLSMTEGWSNARDVKTLADTVTAKVYGSMEGVGKEEFTITFSDLIKVLKEMLRQRIKSGAA